MDVIELSFWLTQRDKVLAALRAEPAGLSASDLWRLVPALAGIDVPMVLGRLRDMGQVTCFYGKKGRSDYVMAADPWYHEPRQRVMRKVVLQLLLNKAEGYSREGLAVILQRRDPTCSGEYTKQLVARLLREGAVITVSGTETVHSRPRLAPGSCHKPRGAPLLNKSSVERVATVIRLSSSRWLKDAAK